jgi:hypothetical protein
MDDRYSRIRENAGAPQDDLDQAKRRLNRSPKGRVARRHQLCALGQRTRLLREIPNGRVDPGERRRAPRLHLRQLREARPGWSLGAAAGRLAGSRLPPVQPIEGGRTYETAGRAAAEGSLAKWASAPDRRRDRSWDELRDVGRQSPCSRIPYPVPVSDRGTTSLGLPVTGRLCRDDEPPWVGQRPAHTLITEVLGVEEVRCTREATRGGASA